MLTGTRECIELHDGATIFTRIILTTYGRLRRHGDSGDAAFLTDSDDAANR
jgi:hypothetical protein